MNNCRHVAGPTVKLPLGERTSMEWHKVYCRVCRALTACHVYNPKPPPQVDQLAEVGYSEKASPNLTGESENDSDPADAFLRGPPLPADRAAGDRLLVVAPRTPQLVPPPE